VARIQGLCHRLGSRSSAEFPENRFNVKLHSVQRDVQLPRNHLVRKPVYNPFQHIELARRQQFLNIAFVEGEKAWFCRSGKAHGQSSCDRAQCGIYLMRAGVTR
jgi:hypothetical protein